MNTDELLQPISDSAPCGEDLSFSAEFDQIAEMRREDDPTLDQGEWVTTLKVADWPGVLDRCSELLRNKSKDLRLAMWWAEAATLTQGYAGLQQGLALCGGLCDRYWDVFYPQPEDGDQEQRIGNLGWFLGRIGALSTVAPITKGRAGAYSLQQMFAARMQPTPDKPLPPEALTLDKFNRALRETPKDDLRASLAALEASQQLLNGLQGLVDAKLGADGPSFVAAREALASALHELQRLAREVGAISGAAGATAAVAESGAVKATAGEAGTAAAGGPPRTREQALAQLREVASFFRATEPHSPVAYLAEKAVQWGDMPLHLWLRAVLKDAGALAHVEELLGVQAPKDENS